MLELAGKAQHSDLDVAVQDLLSIATQRLSFLSNRLLRCYPIMFCILIWAMAYVRFVLTTECGSSYHGPM
jgi:hypothetical protein